MHHGKPQNQAIAIAMHQAGKSKDTITPPVSGMDAISNATEIHTVAPGNCYVVSEKSDPSENL